MIDRRSRAEGGLIIRVGNECADRIHRPEKRDRIRCRRGSIVNRAPAGWARIAILRLARTGSDRFVHGVRYDVARDHTEREKRAENS